MTQAVSASITRRSVVAGLTLTAASVAVLAGTDNLRANQSMPEKSLYERLGGVFAIAAVVSVSAATTLRLVIEVETACVIVTSSVESTAQLYARAG